MMRLISFGIGLLSLLLFCGVAKAGDLQTIRPGPIVTKYADSQGRECTLREYPTGGEDTDCITTLGKPSGGAVGMKPKEVVIPYDDFLKMAAMKEHSDKTANRYAAENAVLVKLKDEQGTVIQLQKEDIQACRDIVKSHEQLGETESQISKAVEDHLREVTKMIATEKRLSRYKSESIVATGIIAAVVYLGRR